MSKINLRPPYGDKNWGLECYSLDHIHEINNLISRTQWNVGNEPKCVSMLRECHAFRQCFDTQHPYIFVEFWTENQNNILLCAETVAEHLGLTLEIEDHDKFFNSL